MIKSLFNERKRHFDRQSVIYKKCYGKQKLQKRFMLTAPQTPFDFRSVLEESRCFQQVSFSTSVKPFSWRVQGSRISILSSLFMFAELSFAFSCFLVNFLWRRDYHARIGLQNFSPL